MTRKTENLKRAAELEAMAEVAANQVEKDALLRVAEGLLEQVCNPTEPREIANASAQTAARRTKV